MLAPAQPPRRAAARAGPDDGQRIDLNLLRVALAVEDCASVTQAAGILGCSQSAVSMGLRRLRAAIGDPLFLRGPNGMTPTPRAVRLLATARPLLAQVDGGLLLEEQFDPGQTRTRFTFAMSDVGEIVFLPRLLERIHRAAPNATVRTVTVKPRELERMLEHGEVDLAIGYFPDLRGKSFREQRLFAHSFSCLVSARHPVVKSGLTRERFLALEHAAVQPEGRSQEIFERFLVAHRIERRVVLTTPHFMSLPMIIARSELIATVPHVIGLFFTRWSEGIRAVAPPFRLPPIVVKQHWHQRYRQDKRHRWLRGVVAELFTDESDEWSR
jgi:DNA-binding transcriptional LysR family regulator